MSVSMDIPKIPKPKNNNFMFKMLKPINKLLEKSVANTAGFSVRQIL